MKILYTTMATAVGGRNGHVENGDGSLRLGLAIPKEMGAREPNAEGVNQATNPEELFAGGYAACFGSALEHIARVRKIETGTITVLAKVGIGSTEGGTFGLTVALDVTLSGVDPAKAEELVVAAHDVCPYSNAIRGNIDVALTAHGTGSVTGASPA